HAVSPLSLHDALPIFGLSLTTKLAPARIVGFMMGVWLLSVAAGDLIAGWIAGLFESYPLPQLFGAVGLTAIGAAVLLALLVKPVDRKSRRVGEECRGR